MGSGSVAKKLRRVVAATGFVLALSCLLTSCVPLERSSVQTRPSPVPQSTTQSGTTQAPPTSRAGAPPQLQPPPQQLPSTPPPAVVPAREMNLAGFTYDRKEVLRGIVSARLVYFDGKLRELRARANERVSQTGSDLVAEQIDNIDELYLVVQDRLGQLDVVEASEWEPYKTQLQNELATFENAFQHLQNVVNEPVR